MTCRAWAICVKMVARFESAGHAVAPSPKLMAPINAVSSTYSMCFTLPSGVSKDCFSPLFRHHVVKLEGNARWGLNTV